MVRGGLRLFEPYRSSVDFDDDLLHLLMDCWHLKDWIKIDAKLALDATAREAVEKNVRGYRVLQLVGDLANGGKHLVLNPQFASGLEPDITKKAVAFDFGSGKVTIDHYITTNDGETITARDLVTQACAAWSQLLKDMGLAP